MASIYKNTKVKSFRMNGQAYYEVCDSGAWSKNMTCPRCLGHGTLSYKISKRPIAGNAVSARTYIYACKGCELEHEPNFLRHSNSKRMNLVLKNENQTEFTVSVLKIHNRLGNKDLKITAAYIEKNLKIKRGWLERKINQLKYYRPVDQEIIEDITQLK